MTVYSKYLFLVLLKMFFIVVIFGFSKVAFSLSFKILLIKEFLLLIVDAFEIFLIIDCFKVLLINDSFELSLIGCFKVSLIID